MSNREDRIVRMGFDNAKFESGAAKSMSTLDRLNEKLKLKGASQGANDVQKSINKVDFSSMERGIASLEKRFSTMGIVGMNVINKITDGITSSVAKLEQATIGQIKSGGWSRAMNIANAKFQIEGLGFQWSEVEKAVSYGVKDTAYGLDAAASAASQLAASGVDFKKSLETVNGQDLTAMHKSLRAISGVAAMTNSSYEDIARIFTTVAGNGRLMGDQLLQLSSRGMNAAAKLAEAMHTTESEVRDMVSKGKIDFQTFAFAMDDAFGQHAKEANKTFTGALGNTKAALSRIGEIFASPVINNTNTLFISLTERIDEFKNKLKEIKVPRSVKELEEKFKGITLTGTAYDQMIKGLGDRTVKFGDDFAAMWKSGIDAFSAIVKSIDLSWFDSIVAKVDEVTVKVKDFFDMIKEIATDSAEEAAEGVQDATKTLLVSAEEAKAAKDILEKGMYGSGTARQKALQELFGGGEEGKQHAKNVQAYIDSIVKANWSYEKATIKVVDANKDVVKSQEDIERENKKAKLKTVLDTTKQSLSNLWKVVKNVGKAAGKILGAVGEGFAKAFNLKTDFNSVNKGVVGFTEWLVKLSQKLVVSETTLTKITDISSKFFSAIKKGFGYVKDGAKYVKDLILFITGKKSEIELLQEEYGNLPGAAMAAITNAKGFKFDLFKKIKEKVAGFIDYIKGIPKSNAFANIKKTVSDTLKDFEMTGSKWFGKENSVFAVIKAVIDGIKDLFKSEGSFSDRLKTFFGKITEAFKAIKIKDVLKVFIITKIVYGIAKALFAFKELGNLFSSISGIPAAISGFFHNFGEAALKAGDAAMIVSVAKAIKEIAEVLLELSKVDDEGLYKAIGTLVIIALVIKYLMNAVYGVNKKAQEMVAAAPGLKKTMSALPAVFGIIEAIGTIGSLIWAIGKGVALMAGGLATIQATANTDDNKNGAAFKRLMTMFGALLAFVAGMAVWVSKVDTSALAKFPIILGSIGGLFLAMSGAMFVVSLGITAMSAVPSGALDSSLWFMLAMFGGIMAVLKSANSFASTDVSKTLSIIGIITTVSGAISGLMVALATSLLIASFGVERISKSTMGNPAAVNTVIGILSGLFLAVGGMVAIAEKGVSDPKKLFVSMLALSIAITAVSTALSSVAKGISSMTSAPIENIGVAIAGMVAICSGMMLIIAAMAHIDEKKMLASSVMFIGIAIVIRAASKSLTKLAESSSEQVWQSAAAIFMLIASVMGVLALVANKMSEEQGSVDTLISAVLKISAAMLLVSIALKIASSSDNIASAAIALEGVIVSIGVVLAIMAAVGSKYGETSQAGAKSLGTAFLMISASMLIISLALSKLGDTQNLLQSALALGAVIVAISLALSLIAIAGGSSDKGADGMMALGAAFIMIAGAMYILALAIKEIASVGPEDLITAAIAFGGFAVVIGILAAVASIIPNAAKAFEAVGKAFLYAGLGAALIGAGIYLISAALAKLAPWLPIIAVGLEAIFTVIENHWPAAIAVMVFTLATIALFIALIDKIRPLLISIGIVIESVAKTISTVLDKISSKGKSWASNLTTKGKATLVAMITALCGALMSASPQMIETIGKLIIKLLGYLGSIAGDIALGLLDFLIEIIYGLADAIMINSTRILAAIRNVLRALGDLILQVFIDIVSAIVDAVDFFNLGWADSVRESGREVSEEIFKLAQDDKKAAEESSKAKRDYLESLKEATDEANEAVAKERNTTVSAQQAIQNSFGGTSSSFHNAVESQISDAERLNKEYANLPGAALNAMQAYKAHQNAVSKESGAESGQAYIEGVREQFSIGNMDPSQYLNGNGDMSNMMAQFGGDVGEDYNFAFLDSATDTNGYYDAMTTNIDDGSIKAMEDKKNDVQDATKKNITDPAIGQIKSSHNEFFDAAGYAIDGAVIRVKSDNSFRQAMFDLADEGHNMFCRRLKINSPSKVFFQNGEYIVEGLINGLDQNEKNAVGSMNNLATAVMAAFGNPIEYCSKIASGELKYTPRIRPVVDSSSLSGSAKSVSSMFDNQNISLNGMTGRLAADIGTLDTTNAEAIVELRGLRADMAVMAKQISNMQLVMDTGALVGSIAGPMDRKLGQRSMLKGRGN